jgi:hypothetical protein
LGFLAPRISEVVNQLQRRSGDSPLRFQLHPVPRAASKCRNGASQTGCVVLSCVRFARTSRRWLAAAEVMQEPFGGSSCLIHGQREAFSRHDSAARSVTGVAWLRSHSSKARRLFHERHVFEGAGRPWSLTRRCAALPPRSRNCFND